MLSLFKINIAQAAVDMTAFGSLLNPIINQIVYPAVLVLFGIAVIVFVYGVLQLVIHGKDPEARKKGQATILYGTIGLFIMVSAWGFIYLISNTIVRDIVGAP